MAAFSKRLKGAMSSYFDAGGKESNGKSGSVFLTEVPSGTAELVAAEEDSTSRGKRKKLEVGWLIFAFYCTAVYCSK